MYKKSWYLMEQAVDGADGGDAGGDDSSVATGGEQTTPAASQAEASVTPVDKGQSQDPAKGYWPEDWVTKLAKGDDKLAKRFSRFASPEALAESYLAAEKRISSGELKTVLPKDPKPEELAQWRKDNGIPETPDKYDLKFDSGLVIGDADKEMIGEFLKTAHGKNMTPDQVKTNIEWYYNEQKRQSDVRLQKDEEQRIEALDKLNQEWGPSFRRNINMVEGLLSQFPENVRASLMSARMPDGTAVFNNPDILRGFAALALEVNPAGTIVPSGGDPIKTIEEEMATIETAMKTDRQAYNKNEKMQARYRELIEAKMKLQERK